MSVAGGAEEADSSRAQRDSKSMSAFVTSDRTADRRSKGVINLLFKSKVERNKYKSHTRATAGIFVRFYKAKARRWFSLYLLDLYLSKHFPN